MKPKIIKTQEEYAAALAHVDSLMDAQEGSAKEAELELWSLLVASYEDSHFPMDIPDPIEAIKFRMDQLSLRQKDLEPFFPGKNRVSEVLNRKRSLTLNMIRTLHTGLGIPAEVLLSKAPA